MQLLVNVLFFVSGVVTTIVVLLGWARHMSAKDAEAEQKALEEQQRIAAETLQNGLAELLSRRAPKQKDAATATDTTDGSSVKERLRRAVELTAKQSQINSNQGPEFIMQRNELELEKLSVLKSIIADGFDPVITIRFNTGDQEMLLSNYIQSISKGLA